MINQRKRVAKRLASGLLAGAVAFGGLALSGAAPASAVPVDFDSSQRIGGADRYATAALVAEELEDQVGSDILTIIVVNGENFPDALAAAPLAGDDTPILPVRADSIPSVIKDRMNRLADSVLDVYVVGGTSAVSASVMTELEAIFDEADVTRIAGDDRYATAAAVGDEVGLDGGLVAIASGTAFADAVSIGGWAATKAAPILLANSSGLPAATKAALETAFDEDDSTSVVILGGPSAVSADVEAELVDIGFAYSNIHRVAGADRYQTNLVFNVENFGGLNKYMASGDSQALQGETILFASGANFPDALSAAPLAAKLAAHVVLVDPTAVGSSALTLAAVGKSGFSIDGLSALAAYGIPNGENTVTAAVTDDMVTDDIASQINAILGGTNNEGDDYFGQSVWVIGGASAVPEAVTTTIAATASSSLACSISVAGAYDSSDTNVQPKSFTIAFGGDLSYGEADDVGELSLLDGTSEIAEYIEIEGDNPTVANVTQLDLNSNGQVDALSVTTSETYDEGDDIEFLGWDEDTDDYTTTGAGLRALTSCSAKVARDRTAPSMSIDAADGGTYVYVNFSEKLGTYAAGWTTEVEDLIEDSASGASSASCSTISSNKTFECIISGGVLYATDVLDFDNVAFYDQAGNDMSEAADGETWVTDAGDGEVEISSVTPICKAVDSDARLQSANDGVAVFGWSAVSGNTAASDAAATVTIDNDGDGFTITAKSGNRALTSNDWTFTIEHSRGLLQPTMSVDGTDVVITIDRFFHTDTDIAHLVNRSTVGSGGLSSIWEVGDDDGELLGADPIDEEYSPSGTGGSEGTVSCLIVIALDGPMTTSVTTANMGVSSEPDDAGEIAVRIGGAYQTDLECDYGPSSVITGTTIYCLAQGVTDTGTVRVDVMAGYMDDTSTETLDSKTA